MPRFLTQEWFADLVTEINRSEEYRKSAADWEGDIAFHVEAEPDRGVPDDIWGLLDLWHGGCRAGDVIDPERGAQARYAIRAPYTRWKDVVMGNLDPVRGMMQGKLKVRGDLPTIVRYVQAASDLVEICGLVETEFPDEV